MKIGLELSSEGRVLLWRSLDRGRLSVGSNPECSLSFPEPSVSPVQFVLVLEGKRLILENKASSGTRVNGEVVHDRLQLAAGDVIDVGFLSAAVCFRDALSPEREIRTKTLVQSRAGARGECMLRMLGDPESRSWSLTSEQITVGTDPTNTVVLNDAYASRFHAEIYLSEGRVRVRDLDSRNGVYVGEQKLVDGEVPDGATMSIGKTKFVFSTDGNDRHEPSGVLFLGKSPAAVEVRRMITRLGPADAPVLVSGETGTGKEVVARSLVEASSRREGPFVVINCGALSRALIESELFGHEKGAFTGALTRKIGAFEAADGGTLFLDEIGELPLDLQPQFLRVLEQGEIRRVGGMDTVAVNTRLIAATNRDLVLEVAAGRFREDLFHRLHVLALSLPPLKARKDDIVDLSEHFLRGFAPAGSALRLSDAARSELESYRWPGNVRELRNVLQRAVLLRSSDDIGPEDIHFQKSTLETRVTTVQATSSRTLAEIERDAIVAELSRHKGNRSEVAAALGVARSTIHRKMEDYGINA